MRCCCDGTGAYNIIDLRPGEYTVTFTLPGFGTLVRDQLILGADVAMPLDAVMSVGSVEETITVSGETPVVDVQQVQRIEVMTRETQETIPTGRSRPSSSSRCRWRAQAPASSVPAP